MIVKKRDLKILELAAEGAFEQGQVPWFSTYQGKIRRLRQLCQAGLLEMDFYHRQKPNIYSITAKGVKVLQWRQKMVYVKQKEVK